MQSDIDKHPSMKTILLDADGLVLKKFGYFSDRFADEYGIPPREINSFFKNEFRICQQGHGDLKEEIARYLPKWKWIGGVDKFLEYWFVPNTLPDEEVLGVTRKLRHQGVKCYVASNQEKYRAEYIRKILHFDKEFDGCFFSHEIGYQKSEEAYFEYIINVLEIGPEKIMYWDNEQKNVDTAKNLGIDAKLYLNLDQFKKEVGLV